jgi:hypothetical protein
MVVLKNVYYDIIYRLSHSEYEAGGILGGKDGVISQFILDDGQACYPDKYIPNVLFMNRKIDEWIKNGIEFYGMIHSHLTKVKKLSNEDVIYIKRIMTGMPDYIKELYFPLVIPEHQIVPFIARRSNDTVLLVQDKLQIV